jgi:hypothetical protein
VEAGKNISTIIVTSRKRRRKYNPVVSDETVMYGYESSATLTTDRLHYKLQTRPFVREGAPRRRAKQLSSNKKEIEKSGHGLKGVPDTTTNRPTDRRSHQLNSRQGVTRVEAGKNTSTLTPASRKRRRKGNPVVSYETVMYGYESSATLTTDILHYKLQTHPLAKEGALRRRAKQFSSKRKGN